jgi:geranylgeranyl diphosphate synthase type II
MLSSRIGCITANAPPAVIEAATKYAKNIGIAFQVVDDILDVRGDSGVLGKNTGSDKDSNKSTFVTLLGEESALRYAEQLTGEAIAGLESVDPYKTDKTKTLKDLAEFLLEREN